MGIAKYTMSSLHDFIFHAQCLAHSSRSFFIRDAFPESQPAPASPGGGYVVVGRYPVEEGSSTTFHQSLVILRAKATRRATQNTLTTAEHATRLPVISRKRKTRF